MAKPSSEPPPNGIEPGEEEAETKPFLDHLEDLRWTIIKSLAVLFIGICVAFYGLPWIMAALEWPLRGVGEVIEQPQLFRTRDLKDSAVLVARLKEVPDPLWRHLAERLSPDTKKQLQEADPSKRPSKDLRAA
ncbi:MAG: hypothetical protein HZA91_12250, partial [Verrucomicrobia bacterium]|nr:hypothetical protein [Verrucomicrobiota bacterium]